MLLCTWLGNMGISVLKSTCSGKFCLQALLLQCYPISVTICFIHHCQFGVPEQAVPDGLLYTGISVGSTQSASTSLNM